MLHTTDFEPVVGQQALDEGETVKIHQRLPGGWFLVLGRRGPKRVEAAQLQPLPEPSLFDRWREERTYGGTEQIVTPISVLRSDYHAWLDRQNLGVVYYPSFAHFSRMMRDAGLASFTAAWREPGDRQAYMRRVCPLLLRALHLGAAA